MVRTYKRKTERGKTDGSLFEIAARSVHEDGYSIRGAAAAHHVPFMSLYRYLQRKENVISAGQPTPKLFGYSKHRQVFSDETEEKLEDFILQNCDNMDRLTPKEMRVLAYIYANLIDIKYPENWDRRKEASDDWLQNFLNRRPKLAFRKSKYSARKMDKLIIRKFYDDFDTLLKAQRFEGQHIWSVGETTVTTGTGNQGAKVRLLIAANSLGQTIPPLFIFPLPQFSPQLLRQGPPGCIGEASLTSSITHQIFLKFIKHFRKTVGLDRSLLILSSTIPLSPGVWDYCEARGVALLLTPPSAHGQCLNPIEMAAFTDFKKLYNWAVSSWSRCKKDSLVTMYDIPSIVAEVLPSAITIGNITVGFQAAGVLSFDGRCRDRNSPPSSRAQSASKEKAQCKDTLSVIQPGCGSCIMVKQEPVDEDTASMEYEPSSTCDLFPRVKMEEVMVKIEDDLT